MSSQRLEAIVSALMKPIKDMKQNFDMDLNSVCFYFHFQNKFCTTKHENGSLTTWFILAPGRLSNGGRPPPVEWPYQR